MGRRPSAHSWRYVTTKARSVDQRRADCGENPEAPAETAKIMAAAGAPASSPGQEGPGFFLSEVAGDRFSGEHSKGLRYGTERDL